VVEHEQARRWLAQRPRADERVSRRPAGAVRALLAARGEAKRFHVLGYRDPGRPTTPGGLLEHCDMSAHALAAQAALMITEDSR
jgi:xylulose-5-phosphate/fructose-6-phosphate phosphoketolase